MAKKAKLDILEITIDKKDENELHDDIVLTEQEHKVSDDKQAGKDLISKVKVMGTETSFLGHADICGHAWLNGWYLHQHI